MALLTRKEFAKLIDKDPLYLGVYISRKKLIIENKKLDTNNIINKEFINKHSSIKEFKESEQKQEQQTAGNEVNIGNIDYVVKQHSLKLNSIKLKKEQLEIEKKQAKVMPVDFTIEIFNNYMKGNINGLINDGFSIIDELIEEMNGSFELKLKYKKALKGKFNETIRINHESISKSIIEKANEYALQRNW